MKRFLGFCLTLALATVAVRAAELTDADAVLSFAVAKTAGYDSYSATFTQNMNYSSMKMALTGTLAFTRPSQMRMETSGAAKHELMIIGPDKIMWQEVVIGGVTNVMKLDLQNMPTNNPAGAMMKTVFTRMDPKALIVKAQERYVFTLLPATELHGRRMYVLTGELRADAKLTAEETVLKNMGKQNIFIDQQDGFLCRSEQFDKAGSNTVIAMEFSDIKLNVPLTDNLFIYQPASTANVIDMLQMVLQMMSHQPKPPAAGN